VPIPLYGDATTEIWTAPETNTLMSFAFPHLLRDYVERYMDSEGDAQVESATFVTPQISSVAPAADSADAEQFAGGAGQPGLSGLR
jgi:hypothetical protein